MPYGHLGQGGTPATNGFSLRYPTGVEFVNRPECPATSGNLAFPEGIAADVYIVDRFNYRIRMVDTSGNISTAQGNGNFGFSGDGGAAILASLAFPSGFSEDSAGNLYIADRDNSRIRGVDASGNISTVAESGIPGFSGDEGSAVGVS